MFKCLKALPFVMIATGCATATLQEPDRSAAIFNCVVAGEYVTTCLCLEKAAVSATGTTKISTLSSKSEEGKAFIKALKDAQPDCEAATKKLLDSQE